ncbi:MAG: hypothetical protein E4H15_07590 [Syntrophobacterales bacterium]|nr:MAG: hypothetical protein E4H15_07590 [Syntrophobacterales bacterium]
MTGDRKLKVFYVTQASLVLMIGSAFVTGVSLSGQDLIAFGTIMAALGGGFMGANFGEHYAKAKATVKP